MGGFVHNIDPVMARVAGVDLHWYGFAYTFGFLGLWLWLIARRRALGWSARDVVDACLVFIVCMLVFGRAFDVVVYEWDWYRAHPWQIPVLWTGGMASHGLFLGALVAAILIAPLKRVLPLRLLDELVVPAAFSFGVGRIGNFIEGGVIGTVTDLPWGVKFPGVEGVRHPVALYDGAKNLLLIPLLLLVMRRHPAGSGHPTVQFLIWYGALRFGIDLFRDYESALLGIGPGQYFNLLMAGLGLVLLRWLGRRPTARLKATPRAPLRAPGVWRVALLVLLILLPLGIPTSWTAANIAAKRAGQGAAATSTPREAEAEPMEARAKAIRESQERQSQTQAPPEPAW